MQLVTTCLKARRPRSQRPGSAAALRGARLAQCRCGLFPPFRRFEAPGQPGRPLPAHSPGPAMSGGPPSGPKAPPSLEVGRGLLRRRSCPAPSVLRILAGGSPSQFQFLVVLGTLLPAVPPRICRLLVLPVLPPPPCHTNCQGRSGTQSQLKVSTHLAPPKCENSFYIREHLLGDGVPS